MNKYLSRLVKHTLLVNEDSRDDVYLTIRIIHDKEMELLCYSKNQYYEAFFSKTLSNVESIGRIWRLAQEKYPNLRGKLWEERQKAAGLLRKEFADGTYQLNLFD